MTKLAYGTYHVPDADQYPAAWGARMIYQDIMEGRNGVVWDRTSFIGDPESVDKLVDIINGGAMKEAMDNAQAMILSPGSDKAYMILDTDQIKVVASPQRSFGYLYVTALLKAQDETV